MRLVRKGGAILASRLVQAGLSAASGLLIARALGPEGQGLYALTITVVLFVAALANGGLGLAAVPDLRGGRVPLGRMLLAQMSWLGVAGLVLGVLGVIAWRSGFDVAAQVHLGWNARIAAYALVGTLALLAFDILFYDLLARGRLLTGPTVNLCRALLHLGLLVSLLAGDRLDLGGAVSVYAAAQGLAALAALVVLARLAGRREPAVAESLPGLVIRILRAGWLGQLSAVASLLHLRLDLALVAAWHGAGAVGIYAVAVLVGELLWLLPGALQPLLVYASSDEQADSPRDEIAARAVRLGVLTTAAAALVLSALAHPLLRLLFGEDFAAAAAPLRALLPGIVVFSAGSVLAGDFIGRGRPVWNAQASGVTVAVNILAGVALIPRWAETGAAWASTIAYTAGTLVMIARFRRATALGWSALLKPRLSDFSLRR
ncbi:polysaccharide biosynthesis C-terminal domain-containing protein [bacterium]|nr:polysaccharide biosynthesis C-terminal domain-containing protein [bacterium]MBU1074036.1 polysaccharide biosynthesis C-terminal domain-containing protein [bacterium]MBU1674705.1 polysaccharide biosynthesis C-terminal domain-containing protein [bacterium]